MKNEKKGQRFISGVIKLTGRTNENLKYNTRVTKLTKLIRLNNIYIHVSLSLS